MKFKSNGTKAKKTPQTDPKMGDGFCWEMGIEKKNDNMIRLVPARIESGRLELF